MSKYRFTIYGKLDGLNEMIRDARANIYVSNNKKQKQTNIVAWAVKRAKIPRIDKKIDLEIYWHCKDKRRDKDNVAVGIKYILDGLQVAGVIKNDGWNEIGNLKHNFLIDKENPRVEVVIKELEK